MTTTLSLLFFFFFFLLTPILIFSSPVQNPEEVVQEVNRYTSTFRSMLPTYIYIFYSALHAIFPHTKTKMGSLFSLSSTSFQTCSKILFYIIG